MKEKIELLAKLLKEDKITIEEFAILIEKDIVYIPMYSNGNINPFPVSPFSPTISNPYVGNPFPGTTVIC